MRANWEPKNGTWRIFSDDGQLLAENLTRIYILGPSELRNTAFPPKGYSWFQGKLVLEEAGGVKIATIIGA